MPPLRIACVLLILALPAAASAGKVCLSDDSNMILYQFGNLKVPKKPNTAVAVTGLAFSAVSANALPLSGTLVRDRNTGKLFLGLTRYFQECIVQAQLEDDLSGTVHYDCDLDGATESSYALIKVDCPS